MGRYISTFMFTAGAYSLNGVIMGWVGSSLEQTTEKKAVAIGLVNAVANASYIYTPYLYPKSNGPKYLIATGANASFAFATVAAAWMLRFWLGAKNRKMKREDPTTAVLFAY